MPGLPAALVRHHERLDEIGEVFAKYGFAAWVQRGGGLVSARVIGRLIDRYVDPDIVGMSDGERLRRALTDLGTTWIKLGQMLSLRPDVVGDDVAGELAKLQAAVPPDPSGVAQLLVERELGGAVSDLYRAFDPDPMASGSVAQVHRATLHDGTAVVVKVLHDGVEHRVLEDLELMEGIAAYLEHEDPGPGAAASHGDRGRVLADAARRHRPLEGATEPSALRAELRRRDPTSSSRQPFSELSRRRVLTMSLIDGRTVHRSCGCRGDGMGGRGTGASRRRRVPRDDLPGFVLSRRPTTGQSPPSRWVTHRDP